MVSTTGRTDTDIASRLGRICVGEERGSVCIVKLLSSEEAVCIPASKFLHEVTVGLVIEGEVVVFIYRGVVRTVLLTQGDEPVGFLSKSDRESEGIWLVPDLEY